MSRKSKLKHNLGLGGLLSEDGTLERAFPIAKIAIPSEIKVNAGSLVWDAPTTMKSVEPGKRMLFDFIQLADASESAVLKYAHRWGVLALCSHHDFLVYTNRLWSNPCCEDVATFIRTHGGYC